MDNCDKDILYFDFPVSITSNISLGEWHDIGEMVFYLVNSIEVSPSMYLLGDITVEDFYFNLINRKLSIKISSNRNVNLIDTSNIVRTNIFIQGLFSLIKFAYSRNWKNMNNCSLYNWINYMDSYVIPHIISISENDQFKVDASHIHHFYSVPFRILTSLKFFRYSRLDTHTYGYNDVRNDKKNYLFNDLLLKNDGTLASANSYPIFNTTKRIRKYLNYNLRYFDNIAKNFLDDKEDKTKSLLGILNIVKQLNDKIEKCQKNSFW